MSNQDQTHSICEFAKELLKVYQARVAQDWVEGLIFMSTSGGRVDILTKTFTRVHDFLSLDRPEPEYSGASMEAVVGEFGSGKSHLGYLMKYHFLSVAENTLVIHCQMTGDRTVGQVLARALQNLWLSGHDSQRASGVEMSAYAKLYNIFAGEPWVRETMVARTAKGYLRKLPPAFAEDFSTTVFSNNAHTMSEFLTEWVAKESDLNAVEAFETILGVLARCGVAKRVVFVLDEIEAVSVLDRSGQLAIAQAFQDLHDDFSFRISGLPTFYWIFLSTINFWEEAGKLLPSFFGARDRTRMITPIPGIEKHEVFSLADRYAMLLQLSGRLKKPLSMDQIGAAVEAAWNSLTDTQSLFHMRTVHAVIYEHVLKAGSERGGVSH